MAIDITCRSIILSHTVIILIVAVDLCDELEFCFFFWRRGRGLILKALSNKNKSISLITVACGCCNYCMQFSNFSYCFCSYARSFKEYPSQNMSTQNMLIVLSCLLYRRVICVMTAHEGE